MKTDMVQINMVAIHISILRSFSSSSMVPPFDGAPVVGLLLDGAAPRPPPGSQLKCALRTTTPTLCESLELGPKALELRIYGHDETYLCRLFVIVNLYQSFLNLSTAVLLKMGKQNQNKVLLIQRSL